MKFITSCCELIYFLEPKYFSFVKTPSDHKTLRTIVTVPIVKLIFFKI